MKKELLTSIISVLCLCAVAQTTVPNGGFENWSGGAPVGWTTSINGNIMASIPYFGEIPYPVSMNFGSQVSSVHSGSSALKLMASNFSIPTTDYSFTIPGVAQLGSAGEFSIPLSTITSLMNGGIDSLDMSNIEDLATFLNVVASGIPCESTPSSLKMWIKYLPQAGDSMRVIAFTKLNGTPVSYARFTVGKSNSEYAMLEVPFDNPFAECDSVCVMIISGGMSTDLNTELYVDDVEFDYTVGIADYEQVKINVYPNPATDRFYIAPTSNDRYQYKLMDLTGRCIAKGQNVTGQVEVDVHSLAPGVYMLFLEQKNQTLTKKVVVR